jgi:hypothetical protein
VLRPTSRYCRMWHCDALHALRLASIHQHTASKSVSKEAQQEVGKPTQSSKHAPYYSQSPR